MSTSSAYTAAGVDIDLGARFGAFCGEICRNSYRNSNFVHVEDWSRGHFRGPRGFAFKNLPSGTMMVAGCDGIGTKTIIIAAANNARAMLGAAKNLVAMLAGDITRYGGLPLILLNNLDVKTFGEQGDHTIGSYENVMRGLETVLKGQCYVGLTGETAQMSACVSSEDPEAKIVFNWSGAMLGVNLQEKLIDGSKIKPGHVVVALRDSLRSNGASQIRRYFKGRYGKEWWKNPEAKADIEDAAEPAVLYDNFLTTLNGWHDREFKVKIPVYGIAHLSGGGIHSKFAQDLLFPRGHSAVLESLWDPPMVMRKCVEHFTLSDAEAYTTFNGGQGALVVIDEENVEQFCRHAMACNIAARRAGYISESGATPHVMVGSRFTGECFKIAA